MKRSLASIPLMMVISTDPQPLVGMKIDGISEEVQKNADIQKVFFKALADNPDDRYENVKIFAEELEKACFGRIRWENRDLRVNQQNQYLKIAECEEKLLHDPNDVPAYLDKGIALYNLGRDNDALESFGKVIGLKPSVIAYYHQGLALYHLNRGDDALAAYDKALALSRNKEELASIHIEKGNVLRDLGRDMEAAGAAYDKAIRLNKRLAKKYNDQGKVLSRLGRDEGAQKDFAEVDRRNQEIVRAYINKGMMYHGLGDRNMALEAYKEAVDLNSQNASAQYNMGLVLSELGCHPEAVKALEKAIELNPKHADAYCSYGRALAGIESIESYEKAKTAFDTAIRLNPEHAFAYNGKGMVLLKHDKSYEEAGKYFDEAIRLKPQFAPAHFHNGLALYKRGKNDNALAAFENAIRYNPKDAKRCNSKDAANAYYRKGLVLSTLDDNQGAKKDLERQVAQKSPALEIPDISSQNLEVERTDPLYEPGDEAPADFLFQTSS